MYKTGESTRQPYVRKAIRCIALPALASSLLLMLGCAGGADPAPSESPVSNTAAVTAAPPLDASLPRPTTIKRLPPEEQHSGPIFLQCDVDAGRGVIRKLNVRDGSAIDISVTEDKCGRTGYNPGSPAFAGDRLRSMFNSDFSLQAVETDNYRVGYKNLKTGDVVDVSDIVAPGTAGDGFAQSTPAQHARPMFSDNQLVFLDIGSDTWIFFDTVKREVVRTQVDYPDGRKADVRGGSVHLAPSGDILRTGHSRGNCNDFVSADLRLVTAYKPLWWLTSEEFVGVRLAGREERGEYLAVDTVSAAAEEPGSCGSYRGSPISPLARENAIRAAVSDPTGQKVYFTLVGDDRVRLMSVDRNDPGEPREIPLRTDLSNCQALGFVESQLAGFQ